MGGNGRSPPFRAARKRRTPEHVLADLSFNYLERFVLNCGWVMEPIWRDYGIDAEIRTFNATGEIESGWIGVQLKAQRRLRHGRSGAAAAVDLDVRDVRLWRATRSPVILVVFDGRTRECYWYHVQAGLGRMNIQPDARSVRVHVPIAQRVDEDAVRHFRRLKLQAYYRVMRIAGASEHD